MKISIITVVYNNEKTIQSAMDSVFLQSYPDIEYIIIDGRSTDNTVNIVNAQKYKLGKFVSEKDKGIYDAMNKGISLASGDVIGILNSDDLYEDNEVIHDVMQHFINDRDLDALYGDLIYVKNDNINKTVRVWHSIPYYKTFFEDGHVPPHPTLFLKKAVYEKAGLFDLRYLLAADYEFMLRVFKNDKFKFKYINRLMIRMRLGGATNKSFKNVLNGNKEILAAWKNNGLKPPIQLMPKRIIRRLVQFLKK